MGYLQPFKRNGRIGFRDVDKVIIHAVYDCFKIQGDYILCGRDGYVPEGMTVYTGVYDLFTRYGDLIFGGFNVFEETNSYFLFLLNGEWKREITYQDDWGQNRIYGRVFHKENASWLVLDKDLLSVKRGEDGERVQFKKGFKVEINTEKEDGEYVDYFNIDITLLVEEKPSFSDGFMLTSDFEEAQAIRLSDGESTDSYDLLRHCYESLFYICKDGLLGIATFDNSIFHLGEYFAFTDTVNGYAFAFRYQENSTCAVDCIHFGHNIILHIENAIASCPLSHIVDDILMGMFELTPIEGERGLKSIGVYSPSLFDNPFALKIASGKHGSEFRRTHSSMYWFSNYYKLNDF